MPFQLITTRHQNAASLLADQIPYGKIPEIANLASALIDEIRLDIPEKRRRGIGRYRIVKELGLTLYSLLADRQTQTLGFSCRLYEEEAADPFVRSLAVQLICLHGLDTSNLDAIKPCILRAAGDQNWIVRECSSGFIRRLIREFPDQIQGWYLEMVKSPDPNLRRFVSESLRPVAENRWFHKQPDYALGLIRHLFQESDPYPRRSVGNSLSDWMRVNQELAWPVVQELARSGDPNSYWIAYRACRNHVKKEPRQVLDLLGVDEYVYKNQHYHKKDFQD